MSQNSSSTLLRIIAFLAIVATVYVVVLRPGKQPAPEPKGTGPVVTNEEFQSAITSNPVTLVKFGATWCGPCNYMDEELEKLKAKNFAASILHIDVDSNPELSQKFKANSIPKTILFKDGQEIDTHVGGMSAQEIEEWVAAKTGGN